MKPAPSERRNLPSDTGRSCHRPSRSMPRRDLTSRAIPRRRACPVCHPAIPVRARYPATYRRHRSSGTSRCLVRRWTGSKNCGGFPRMRRTGSAGCWDPWKSRQRPRPRCGTAPSPRSCRHRGYERHHVPRADRICRRAPRHRRCRGSWDGCKCARYAWSRAIRCSTRYGRHRSICRCRRHRRHRVGSRSRRCPRISRYGPSATPRWRRWRRCRGSHRTRIANKCRRRWSSRCRPHTRRNSTPSDPQDHQQPRRHARLAADRCSATSGRRVFQQQ